MIINVLAFARPLKHYGDIGDAVVNRLNLQDRARILGCLAQGNSIRATCRMTGAAKGAVIKLLADMGAACNTDPCNVRHY